MLIWTGMWSGIDIPCSGGRLYVTAPGHEPRLPVSVRSQVSVHGPPQYLQDKDWVALCAMTVAAVLRPCTGRTTRHEAWHMGHKHIILTTVRLCPGRTGEHPVRGVLLPPHDGRATRGADAAGRPGGGLGGRRRRGVGGVVRLGGGRVGGSGGGGGGRRRRRQQRGGAGGAAAGGD